jgi:hypothetical protein
VPQLRQRRRVLNIGVANSVARFWLVSRWKVISVNGHLVLIDCIDDLVVCRMSFVWFISGCFAEVFRYGASATDVGLVVK